tara:strand:+ start:242 stop:679 length:438 start_codon:yes stop_codon:yes gene_type:complete
MRLRFRKPERQGAQAAVALGDARVEIDSPRRGSRQVAKEVGKPTMDRTSVGRRVADGGRDRLKIETEMRRQMRVRPTKKAKIGDLSVSRRVRATRLVQLGPPIGPKVDPIIDRRRAIQISIGGVDVEALNNSRLKASFQLICPHG